MRTITIIGTLIAGLFTFGAGCQTAGKPGVITGAGQEQSPRESTKHPPRRVVMTAENNPTTLAGRGEPSLDDFYRPPAWIYVDGQGGQYIEQDGNPQVQWIIKAPVSSSPTFRVEAYGPLLGTPKDFACTLDTFESADGSAIAYGIKAAEGTFEAGYDYSLLKPGDNFTVRNRITGDVVSEIPPFVPGIYLIAAAVKNLETGKEGLAITYFTVEQGPSE